MKYNIYLTYFDCKHFDSFRIISNGNVDNVTVITNIELLR